MSKPESGPNRHHFRIWVKMAIQSGLIDRLPPLYEPDPFQVSVKTGEYARRLLAALKDPDSSGRTFKEIIADARRFRSWVESRRKDSRRRTLAEGRPEERVIDMPPGRPRERPVPTVEPRRQRTQRSDQPDLHPKLHPMWDDWIDRLER
jgi:hypothetical protein